MDAADRLLGGCRQGQSKSENSSTGQKCNARGPWEEGNSNARSEDGTELKFVRTPENERRRCPGCLELPMAIAGVCTSPPGCQDEVLIWAPARLRNRSAACARSGWEDCRLPTSRTGDRYCGRLGTARAPPPLQPTIQGEDAGCCCCCWTMLVQETVQMGVLFTRRFW